MNNFFQVTIESKNSLKWIGRWSRLKITPKFYSPSSKMMEITNLFECRDQRCENLKNVVCCLLLFFVYFYSRLHPRIRKIHNSLPSKNKIFRVKKVKLGVIWIIILKVPLMINMICLFPGSLNDNWNSMLEWGRHYAAWLT